MFTIDGVSIMAKSTNVWADWALHFTQTSQFVHRSLIPGDHPLLEGASYAYPFGVNWITAIFVRLGVEFFQAHIFLSYLLSILLVVILIVFLYRILDRKGSAVVAGLIFFLNGGLGFVLVGAERLNLLLPASNFLGELTLLPSVGIRWINVITSMIVPQRAFTLGFPVGMLVLLIVVQQIKKNASSWSFGRFLVAGLIAGTLPILHMHSYLAIGVVFGWYTIWSLIRNRSSKKRLKKGVLSWLLVLIPAVLVPLPFFLNQYANTIEKTTQGSFIQWYPGWFTNAGSEYPEMSIIWFWLINWGVVIPLAIVGFFLARPVQRGLLIPFFLLFVLSNLFLFQPFVWDNTKILVWASVGLSIASAIPIWNLLNQPRFHVRAIGGLLLLIAILSGAHDAGRLIRPDQPRFGMYNSNDLVLARELRERSEPNETIITAPLHNNPFINFSGRNILLGYKGWLWTYGLDYSEVQKDMMQILAGGDKAEALIEKYNVKFVIIDPSLQLEWKTNTLYFEERFPVEHRDQFRVIYRLK